MDTYFKRFFYEKKSSKIITVTIVRQILVNKEKVS